MRRVQRNLDAALARRAFLRAAIRDGYRKAEYGGGSGFVPVIHKADFECYRVCLDCGYFGSESGTTCPSCDGGGWVDLTLDESSDMVRDIEAKRRATPPKWVKAIVAITLVSGIVGVGIATGGLIPYILIAMALAIPAYFLCLKPVTRLLARPSMRMPSRWHGPLHPKQRVDEPTVKASGKVLNQGGLLTAPFSGTPCVAFEVAIRHHDSRSLRAPQWLLRESRSIDFQVGDVLVGSDTAVLTLDLEAVNAGPSDEGKARIARYLRERGLVDNDGKLDVYESCLVEGQTMVVEKHSNPAFALVGAPDAKGRLKLRSSGPYR